jgi:hypothetical protein
MRILRGFILILFATIFVSCEKQAATQADILVVKLGNDTPYEQRHAKPGEMREFVWKHWIERKQCSLRLTTVTKEGSTNHAEYKVVVLPANTIMLKVTFIHDRIGYQGQVIPKPNEGYEAYTVERVQSDSPDNIGPEAKITVLHSDAVVSPADYRLRFKGWNGDLIAYL